MKNTLLSLSMLFFAISGFSQGVTCTIFNTINSGSVQVDLYASPMGSCQVGCVIQSICLYPGQFQVLNGCGPDFYEWSYAVVTPTTDDCSFPCTTPPGITIVSANGCIPATDTDFHCHAGINYTSTFFGNFLLIG